jgi:hypothetical protein
MHELIWSSVWYRHRLAVMANVLAVVLGALKISKVTHFTGFKML